MESHLQRLYNVQRCTLQVIGPDAHLPSLARAGAAQSHGKVSFHSKTYEQFGARFSEVAEGDRFRLRSGTGLAFEALWGGQSAVLLASLDYFFSSGFQRAQDLQNR